MVKVFMPSLPDVRVPLRDDLFKCREIFGGKAPGAGKSNLRLNPEFRNTVGPSYVDVQWFTWITLVGVEEETVSVRIKHTRHGVRIEQPALSGNYREYAPVESVVCCPDRGETHMRREIGSVTVVVRDYDEAISYYRSVLDFVVVEDRPVPKQDKRWIRMAPGTDSAFSIVLGRAADERQRSRTGDQTGGRVFLFLHTDDIERDYRVFRERGVGFVRAPQRFDYGTVAVFRDLYGNLWDLIESERVTSPHAGH